MEKGEVLEMRNRTYHFFWIGQSFANFGDVFYIVSIVTYLYHLTSKAMATALIPFLVTVSLFISGIIAPVFFEKFKLKNILAYGQLFKTILLMFLFIRLNQEIMSSIWIIYIIVLLISFLDGVSNPIKSSLVPLIVDKEKILKANSILNTLDQFIKLSAWPIGSLVVAFSSPLFLINITLLFYVISCILMFLLHIEEQVKEKDDHKKGFKKFVSSISLGWKYTYENSHAKSISLMSLFEGIGNGVWISAILYVYVKEQLNLGEEWWGYINSVFFGGMVIGGILIVRFNKSIERNQSIFILFSPFVISVVTFLFGTTQHAWLALFYSMIYGITEQFKFTCLQTVLQRNVASNILPNVFAVQGVISSITFGISTLLLSFIADIYGIKFSFYVSVLCFVISGFISYKNKEIWKYTELNRQTSTTIL